MFFSHQLLARKAPLGQIWMAATMKCKIDRRKLGKLNIIQICEEILNPSVPMALRLSGILMGGVVIVYERKVKLLYDDVSRLLVEINDAWKTKVVPDPAVLPKNKSRTKHEAVTVSVIQEMEIPEVEQSLNFSNAASMEFQHTAYVSMRLDDVEEPFYENNARGENFHQADPAEITTHDFYDPSTENANIDSHFERFDIDGYDDTQVKFTSQEQTELPTLIPSPPAQQEPLNADEIPNRYSEQHIFQKSDECPRDSLSNEGKKKQEPPRKRARKPAAYVMDCEQTTIPGHTFQSWLQDTSDIVTERGRKRKHPDMKISNLMELPPVALLCGLVRNGGREIHYPAPIMELWLISTQNPLDSPSGRNSQHQPPEPSSSSPQNGLNNADPMGYPFEDFHSGIDSTSIERLRRHVDENLILEHAMELRRTASNPGTRITETNLFATPGSSGDEIRSMTSAGTGSHPSHPLRRRPYSSSGKVNIGLDPVYEDYLFHHFETNFKLSELPGSGQAVENEVLMETGPTQTQYPVSVPVKDHSKEQITDSIRMGFKTYFETPGAPRTESLHRLTSGVNRKQAALLFYQTCVLTTLDFIKVEQKVPYGDIFISRGAKM